MTSQVLDCQEFRGSKVQATRKNFQDFKFLIGHTFWGLYTLDNENTWNIPKDAKRVFCILLKHTTQDYILFDFFHSHIYIWYEKRRDLISGVAVALCYTQGEWDRMTWPCTVLPTVLYWKVLTLFSLFPTPFPLWQ